MNLDKNTKAAILSAQKNEITEFYIYKKLAKEAKGESLRTTLEQIALQERNHYEKWKKITGQEVRASQLKVIFYYFLTRLFGLAFGLRLMEQGEKLAIQLYQKLGESPVALELVQQEQIHEEKLLGFIEDKRLRYMSSFVLGLNDALVELTGALAGLTLALQNTRLIAMVGVITGIAASLSMAASSYLAAKEEESKKALSSGLVTGLAYILTVVLLVISYFIVGNPFIALGITLGVAVLLIALFTFYTSVAKNLPFTKKFFEMAAISLSVAVLNFVIGFLIKRFLGVN